MCVSDALKRRINLLGAAVLALSDDMDVAVARAAGQAGQAPAALVELAEHPGLTVDGLRRRLKLTHPAVVRLLDRLDERGLVRRRRGGGADARTTSITLTDAGAVTGVSISNRSWGGAGSSEAESCIRNKIRSWRFPSGNEGTYGFSFNFTR